MKLLDSSVLIAYLNESDSLHEKALLLDLKESVLNELVFAEVANVLQKRIKDREKLARVLGATARETPFVLVSASDLKKSLKLFFEHYPKISFTDASLLAQAAELKAEILTFDERLSEIYERTVKTL